MNPKVLIVGAGPTGLTLAIELARRDVRLRIIEKAATFFAGSRGDGLQPRTLEVFEDLGVLDAVFDAGSAQVPMRIYADGEVVREERMSELKAPAPDVPYPNVWFLGQSDTERILRARLAEFGIRVELATELIGFDQDGDGVNATLRRNGEPERIRVDHLVGADGGRSVVRKTLGLRFEGSTDESIRMLLGDVRVDGLDHGYGHWFASKDDPTIGIVLTPLPGGDHFQFGAPLREDTAEHSLQALQALLDTYTGRLCLRLRDLSWSTVWRPNVRLAERFRDGRVFIAGDAAHVHPPTGGQGLNTGIQDAYNLGWKLADGSPDLLDSYQAERRQVAAEVLGLSSELMRKYVDGDEDAFKRDEETHQLAVGYRTSPLNVDERAEPGRLRCGDRAPDAPLRDADGSRVRLFELFRGPHETVLVFGHGPAEGAHVHRILPAGDPAHNTDLVDADGHTFAAYDASMGDRFLIRPDGYIGRVSRPSPARNSSPGGIAHPPCDLAVRP